MPDRDDFRPTQDTDRITAEAYAALERAKAAYTNYRVATQVESPEERRRKFFLIRGGRSLVAAPIAVLGWIGREVRAHATATVTATATAVVVGGGALAAVTTIGGTDPVQAAMDTPGVSRPIETPYPAMPAPLSLLDAAAPQPDTPLPAGAFTLFTEDGETREPPVDLDVIPVDEDGNPLPIPEPTLPPVLPPLDDGREPGVVPTLPPVPPVEEIVIEPPPVDDGREIDPPFIEPPIELPPFLEPPVEEEEEEPPVVVLPPVEGDGRGEEEGDGRG